MPKAVLGEAATRVVHSAAGGWVEDQGTAGSTVAVAAVMVEMAVAAAASVAAGMPVGSAATAEVLRGESEAVAAEEAVRAATVAVVMVAGETAEAWEEPEERACAEAMTAEVAAKAAAVTVVVLVEAPVVAELLAAAGWVVAIGYRTNRRRRWPSSRS